MPEEDELEVPWRSVEDEVMMRTLLKPRSGSSFHALELQLRGVDIEHSP
jgi:hypothetical protein